MKSKRVHKIKKALNYKVTWAELYDFEKLLPATNSKFSIPIRTNCHRETYYIAISRHEPYIDFWRRWNRWQTLKVFI